MQYMKTVNLWDTATAEAIAEGKLQLQRGQWVTCGEDNPHRARWVGFSSGGTAIVAHWQGSGRETKQRFDTLRRITH